MLSSFFNPSASRPHFAQSQAFIISMGAIHLHALNKRLAFFPFGFHACTSTTQNTLHLSPFIISDVFFCSAPCVGQRNSIWKILNHTQKLLLEMTEWVGTFNPYPIQLNSNIKCSTILFSLSLCCSVSGARYSLAYLIFNYICITVWRWIGLRPHWVDLCACALSLIDPLSVNLISIQNVQFSLRLFLLATPLCLYLVLGDASRTGLMASRNYRIRLIHLWVCGHMARFALQVHILTFVNAPNDRSIAMNYTFWRIKHPHTHHQRIVICILIVPVPQMGAGIFFEILLYCARARELNSFFSFVNIIVQWPRHSNFFRPNRDAIVLFHLKFCTISL